jgi:hypothetical protein
MPPPNPAPKPARLLAPDDSYNLNDLKLPADSSATPLPTGSLGPLAPSADSGAPAAKLPVLKRTAGPSDPSLFLAPVPAPPPPPLPVEPPPLPEGLGQHGSLQDWSGYDLPAVSGSKVVSPPKSRTIPASVVPVPRKSVAAPIYSTPTFSTEKIGLNQPPVARKLLPWRSGWLWSIGAGVLCILAFAVFWIAFNTKKDSDNVAELPPIPVSRVLTPQDAVSCIGEKRTVEFTVGHRQQGDEWAYLYESAPGHADLQFRVAISNRLITSMRNRGSHWPYVLDGALLRLEGPITRNGKFAEIQAGDIDQFHKIIYAK